MAAIYPTFQVWLDLHWIIALPLSLIFEQVAAIGTMISKFGAINQSAWSLTEAILLFTIPLIIGLLFSIMNCLLKKVALSPPVDPSE